MAISTVLIVCACVCLGFYLGRMSNRPMDEDDYFDEDEF